MSDDEIQEAVTVFLVRLSRRVRNGSELARVILRVAGLMGAFYVEYMRDMRRKTHG